MKSYELSPVALRALNQMRERYLFLDGPALLESVLAVLSELERMTRGQRRLRRELEAMPLAARESLSRAIRAAWSK